MCSLCLYGLYACVVLWVCGIFYLQIAWLKFIVKALYVIDIKKIKLLPKLSIHRDSQNNHSK